MPILLSATENGAAWLSRFTEPERSSAASLIDEVLLVGRDELSNGIFTLLDDLFLDQPKPGKSMALYAERPIKLVFGRVAAFFPHSRHGRATGTGPQPIVADPRDQEVGSEGIIAQLITDYCRANPHKALSHPGPDKMRTEKVGLLVIVSDFIGSGRRIEQMLEFVPLCKHASKLAVVWFNSFCSGSLRRHLTWDTGDQETQAKAAGAHHLRLSDDKKYICRSRKDRNRAAMRQISKKASYAPWIWK